MSAAPASRSTSSGAGFPIPMRGNEREFRALGMPLRAPGFRSP